MFSHQCVYQRYSSSDGGKGENTSSGPTCSSLLLAFRIPRQINLERHTSFFIPLSFDPFSTWEDVLDCLSIPSSRQLRKHRADSCTHSLLCVPSSGFIYSPSMVREPSSIVEQITTVWHKSCTMQILCLHRSVHDHLTRQRAQHCDYKRCGRYAATVSDVPIM